MYRVTWTEVSKHEVELTAVELADLLGVEVDEMALIEEIDCGGSLVNSLGGLSRWGFVGLTREDVEIEEV